MSKILIIDYGSQLCLLISRIYRNFGIETRTVKPEITLEEIKELNPAGIILSGSPHSVYDKNAPSIDKNVFDLGIPILGICYGMQLICFLLGGKVERSDSGEYEVVALKLKKLSCEIPLFHSFCEAKTTQDGRILSEIDSMVHMNHGDKVVEIPEDFVCLGSTDLTEFAAIKHKERDIYGVQFHPEAASAPDGLHILLNFHGICRSKIA